MRSSICRTSSSVCGANLISDHAVYGRRRGRAGDVGSAPAATRPGGSALAAGEVLEPVLGDEGQVVALVEDLAIHARIQLAEPPDLAVLLGDQALVERRDLDVEVVGSYSQSIW
jgi:hypothetical protein